MSHKARKRFGQNFLQDHNIIRQILAHAQIQKNEHWVEIGPGLGALTGPLLEQEVKLDVVELDRDLVALLEKKFSGNPNFRIHSGDALAFDFHSLSGTGEKLRIIGNLPYNISTPLLFHLLSNAVIIEDMLFMLQKEVIDRICAAPGSKKYGRLSVMMQYYCDSEHLFDVPPESFEPAPKVMSAIVRCTPHREPPVKVDDVRVLEKTVTAAFSQRRKTIRNSLKKLLTEQQISELEINPNARAEEISLQEFARLANSVA